MGKFDFSTSNALLERALKVIPNGTQTFSKSRTQYPVGNAPLYIQRAKGSHVWDVDGNEYIDFVSGLGSIILGYCDPDVDNAVMEQMKSGSIFSLPHPIEIEVSEMLRDLIPCAEMVRFGKNGSDVTAGAVRLARYITGRDHVIVCEGHYHGWQDWCCSVTGRNGGIPNDVKNLTHVFKYNDIVSLRNAFTAGCDVACVIMEPMTCEFPKIGFLESVKEICHKNGALFIFDEMLTGFRWPMKSAQRYYGIIPDIACFGKSMGNGYPISALVGKAEYMSKLQEIHFSFTFGGDCIALAAAEATLKKIDSIFLQAIYHDVYCRFDRYLQGSTFRPKWDFSNFTIPQAREKIFQFFYENGILMLDYVNLNMGHTVEDINKLEMVFNEAKRNLNHIELRGARTDSLFRVRA